MKMGGVETGTLDLSRELVRQGHTAFVVSGGGPLVKALEEAGAEHIQLPVYRKSLFNIFSSARILRQIIQKKQIQIVHARSRVPAWIAWLAVRKTSARFITTAHGYYRPHWGSRVMGWAEKVIAVSGAIQDHLIQNFHAPKGRIRLIARGVNLEQFPFVPKSFNLQEPCIGMVGRITPLKGHEFFLAAMKEVIKVFPKARGVVIGDAPSSKTDYYNRLLKLRDELGLIAHVHFLPGTADVAEEMKKLDLLVLATTVPEAFGRVLVEAQAVGTPVIGTRVGGVLDIIQHEKNGWLVPPSDSLALAQTMIQVFQNPEQLRRVVHEARASVEEKFHLDLMVAKTLKVYEEVLKSPKVLVIKLSALGDIILSSPSLRTLKQAYPNSEMILLVQDAYQSVAADCPYLEGKITCSKKTGLKAFLKILHEIRLRRFDLLIDLQNNKKSHLLGFLSAIPKRVGYARQGRGFLLTHKISYHKDTGPVESQNRLLGLLGLKIQDNHLEMWTSLNHQRWVENFLREQGVTEKDILIALFPFSNPRWQTKRWGIENFRKLAQEMHDRLNAIPVFIGGKEDQEEGRKMMEGFRFRHLDLIGKIDIGTLAELLKKCRVWVGGDSAPLHIAAGVRTPVIAFFGPTDPQRHAPPGDVKVLTYPIFCAPCYSPICKIQTHDCLEKVSVEQVSCEIEKVLKK